MAGSNLILGPISFVDCGIFLAFLFPSLLADLGLIQTLSLIKTIPFLAFQLPFQLIHERYFTNIEAQSPFAAQASLFQDVVIRAVRYAFANVSSDVGRVFFSRSVALPFFRFRLWRHGFPTSPIHYEEIRTPEVCGVWLIPDTSQAPDIVIYYCHGGGFTMGSPYFYMEFLMAWTERLKAAGFKNPAVFAVSYSLVPAQVWPGQYEQVRAGYSYLCKLTGDSSKICLSGDSGGATLMMSMLLFMKMDLRPPMPGRPGLAVLISPWTHLISPYNRNTSSDYLDQTSLHKYARQYMGKEADDDKSENGDARPKANGTSISLGDSHEKSKIQEIDDHVSNFSNDIMSPGLNKSWKDTAPKNGYHIVYGAEEVLAVGIAHTVQSMKKDGCQISTYSEKNGIHAWPVVNLFLGRNYEERIKGVDVLTDMVAKGMAAYKS